MTTYKFEKIGLKDFDSLYSIMENSFPSIERRSYEGQKDLFNEDRYNVIGYKDENNRVLGFLAFWKFEKFNFIEHFAVDNSLRGNGIGTKLFKKYFEINKKMTILEVEHPDDEVSARRIKYYERLGMKLNDYEYMQPPLQEDKPLLPLKIMSYEKELTYDEFDDFRVSVYDIVYKYMILA